MKEASPALTERKSVRSVKIVIIVVVVLICIVSVVVIDQKRNQQALSEQIKDRNGDDKELCVIIDDVI